jgi:hypothetical protein
MRYIKTIFLLVLFFLGACTACPVVAKQKPVTPKIAKKTKPKAISSLFIDALDAVSVMCKDVEAPLVESKRTYVATVRAIYEGEVIFYDEKMMLTIQKKYGDAAIVGTFGHELGHICDFRLGIEPTEEHADVFGGCALGLLGYPTAPFEDMLSDLSKTPSIHGTIQERSEAVDHGFKLCSVAIK